MSYLSSPRLHFSGTFRADPSTLNNTPDNFNLNNNFPPNNGSEVSNNLQLYWNPNGTAAFELACEVTKVCYADGSTATTAEADSLVGQPLYSLNNDSNFKSAKVVDLDPMQQNVTEIYGLQVGIGTQDASGGANILSAMFRTAAYSNAWIQVVGGQGDYAGSVIYQSVLQLSDVSADFKNSPFLKSLEGAGAVGNPPALSMSFVLRSFNGSSHQYLVNDNALAQMNLDGVPKSVTDKLQPLKEYNQGPKGGRDPDGQIPTTSYFAKLLKAMLTKEEYNAYQQFIIARTEQKYTPKTDYDFTWGQAFGTIGLQSLTEPEFFTPDRMLTPVAVALTAPPIQVPTDAGTYAGYFAPCKLNQYTNAQGQECACVTVNLGNSLPSTQPAADTDSYVDVASLQNLQLCCFPDGLAEKPKLLGEIAYAESDFYMQDAGMVDVPIEATDVGLIEKTPLGIVSVNAAGAVQKIVLQENSEGYYLRANQFVYRMNPGMTEPEVINPASAEVEIYASQFGEPVAGQEIEVSMIPSLEAAVYSNNTLGTSMIGICQGWTQSSESSRQRGRCLQQ